ncbi:MAG: hypothetical protein V7754_08710 [Halioglobus sp.]
MSHDDIDHIPSIVPRRDSDHPSAPSKGRSAKAAGKGRPARSASPGPTGGGAGIWARLFISVSLVVAAVACAWAFQLQGQLQQSGKLLSGYEQRISDLEDRLSDTDEGMSQNATVQAAKIRELDKEVRKLWDNVWKKADKRLKVLESSSASNTKKIASATKAQSGDDAQLKSLKTDLAKLKTVAGDLDRLMSSAKSNQAEVERVADSLNKMKLDNSKLSKRVQSNEEWVGSVNAFRRQVNSSLTQMQASIRALEAAP